MITHNRFFKGVFAVSVTAITVLGVHAYEAKSFKGRIAITTDGNQHDHDDYGASPVSLLLIAKAKLQDKLVHFDYNSHIEDSSHKREAIMNVSILDTKERLGGFSPDVFFDDTKQLKQAIDNIKKIVNESSADNPLYFALGGPAEVLWRGLNAADPAKRKFVHIVSHSWWNEGHAGPANKKFYSPRDHSELVHNIDDVIKLGVTYRPINEQNKYFNTHKKWKPLTWMKNHVDEHVKWVYSRIEKAGKPDYSDAGMTWYILTKNDRGTVDLFKKFIGIGKLFDNAPVYPPVVEPLQSPGLKPVAGSNIRLAARTNGKYVRVDNPQNSKEPALHVNNTSADPWTRFRVKDAGNGFVALKAYANGNYVRISNGQLRAAAGDIDDEARFKFSKNNDGTYFLYSKAVDKYIVADKGAQSVDCLLKPLQSDQATEYCKFEIRR